MKNIILIISIVIATLLSFASFDIVTAGCSGGGGNIGNALDNCLSGSKLVKANGNMDLSEGVKQKIVTWTNGLAAFLALIAVGAVVYGGLLMTLSGGEDERIKKGKDVVKWSLIGFLGLIVAGGLVRVVITVIFSLA